MSASTTYSSCPGRSVSVQATMSSSWHSKAQETHSGDAASANTSSSALYNSSSRASKGRIPLRQQPVESTKILCQPSPKSLLSVSNRQSIGPPTMLSGLLVPRQCSIPVTSPTENQVLSTTSDKRTWRVFLC
eukprot:scpid107894/ scgid27476/ 